MIKQLVHSLIPLLPLVVLAALAECLVRFGVLPSYLVPTPSDVLMTLWIDAEELTVAVATTGLCSVIGLMLSFIAGSAVAIVLSVSNLLRRALYPYAVFFQTVPVISVAPLLVVWFGFGKPTVIASAFLVSIFPVIASTMLGFASTERNLLDLFRLYGATRRQTLWSLRLPSALPQILGGLRIAAGLAVIGAIVGEFIGGGGLGSVVDVARTQQRVDKVFAAVLLSSALGFVLVAAINQLSKRLLGPWHASEQ